MKRRLGVLLLFVLVVAVFPPATAGEVVFGSVAQEGSRFTEAAVGSSGAVASVDRRASEIGLQMLSGKGNAIDAAVATVIALGVVRPEMCGLGGGGFMVYRESNGRSVTVDFREQAPAAHEHSSGVAEAGLFAGSTGRNRIGVPGTVAGMDEALRRLGRLKWADVLQPSISLARDGFEVSRDLSLYMGVHAPRLRLYPETARTYLLGGVAPYPEGARLAVPDLADSLDRLAQYGAGDFYNGAIAAAIAQDLAGPGEYAGDKSYMTLNDLSSYRAIWRKPLEGTYRGHDIIAAPPPTSGGLATIEILNLLEGYDLASSGFGSGDHLHHMLESQKLAWADRNAFVADPAFTTVPVEMMTSKEYAAQRRLDIDPAVARATYEPGNPAQWSTSDEETETADEETEPQQEPENPQSHTAHVSVIDAAGNAVSVTCSMGTPFGSAVVIPGTGLLMGDVLEDFSGGVNAPQGGKRPRSSISPTIVVAPDGRILSVGAAGGSAIPLAVIQTILNRVDFGMDLAHAVDAPRADARQCQEDSLVVCFEFARIPGETQVDLTGRGHTMGYPYCALAAIGGIPRCTPEYHVMPEVQAVEFDPASGTQSAVSDPRGEWGAVAR